METPSGQYRQMWPTKPRSRRFRSRSHWAVDIAPFAYVYHKGAANNPIETQWLSPTPDMLCGLLWEERRSVERIEVLRGAAPARPGASSESLRPSAAR